MKLSDRIKNKAWSFVHPEDRFIVAEEVAQLEAELANAKEDLKIDTTNYQNNLKILKGQLQQKQDRLVFLESRLETFAEYDCRGNPINWEAKALAGGEGAKDV